MGCRCLGCPKGEKEGDEPEKKEASSSHCSQIGLRSQDSIDMKEALSPSPSPQARPARKRLPLVGLYHSPTPIIEAAEAQESSPSKSTEDRELILRAMRSILLFQKLTPAQLESITKVMKRYELGSGRIVFEQGQPGASFFVLVSGSLEVTMGTKKMAVLTQGSGFGEVALLHEGVRTATVKSTSQVVMWGIDRAAFRRYIENANAEVYQATKALIAKAGMFAVLNPLQREALIHVATTVKFPEDTVILTEGYRGEVCYIIKEGSVTCMQEGKKVRKLTKGDYFGEQSLLYGGKRTSTIVADSEVECISISREDLELVLGSNLQDAIYRNTLKLAFSRSKELQKLNQVQTEKLISAMQLSSWEKDQILIPAETARGSGLWVVLSGAVRRANRPETLADDFGCIGDEDLVNSVGYTYTEDVVICSETADIASIPRPELERCIGGEMSSAKLNGEVFNILKRIPALRSLTNETLSELTLTLQMKTYADKEVIAKQGSPGESFHIVQAGRVQIVKDGVSIRIINTFDYFGEMSVLLSEPRPASAISKGQSTCWVLSRSEFCRIIDEKMRKALIRRIELLDSSVLLADLIVLSTVSSSSTGTVLTTVHPAKQRIYTLRAVGRNRVESLGMKEQVVLERRVMLQLDHICVRKLIKTFKDSNNLYFLMEFVDGIPFADVLDRSESPMLTSQLRFYIGYLLFILQFLHERDVLYRNLTPHSILIDTDGYPKLIDFSSAKVVQGRTYTVIGNPHYMAPEVILGVGYSADADYWSLGVVLYECICGKVPFGEGYEQPFEIYQKVLAAELNFPSRVPEDIVDEVRPLLELLLNKNPALRHSGDTERLKSHRWFSPINWVHFTQDKLISRQLPAPFEPVLPDLEDAKTTALHKGVTVLKALAVRVYRQKEEGAPTGQRLRASTHWDDEF